MFSISQHVYFFLLLATPLVGTPPSPAWWHVSSRKPLKPGPHPTKVEPPAHRPSGSHGVGSRRHESWSCSWSSSLRCLFSVRFLFCDRQTVYLCKCYKYLSLMKVSKRRMEKSIEKNCLSKKLFSPITNPKSTPHKSIEIDIPYFGCISVDTFEESIEIFSVFRYFFTEGSKYMLFILCHMISCLWYLN